MEININTDLSPWIQEMYFTIKADGTGEYRIHFKEDAPREVREELKRRVVAEGYDAPHTS